MWHHFIAGHNKKAFPSLLLHPLFLLSLNLSFNVQAISRSTFILGLLWYPQTGQPFEAEWLERSSDEPYLYSEPLPLQPQDTEPEQSGSELWSLSRHCLILPGGHSPKLRHWGSLFQLWALVFLEWRYGVKPSRGVEGDVQGPRNIWSFIFFSNRTISMERYRIWKLLLMWHN